MVNKFFKFIIILVFLSTSVFSEEITNIEITGNKRISKQTILVLGDISKMGVTLSLQTENPEVLKAINRRNVTFQQQI